jgi:membrane fusion protein, multidrug efflux system
MASKAIYSVIAVVGIAAASGAAYWYQNKPSGPTEITGAQQASGTVGAPATGASAARPAGGPGGPAGVEVAKVEVSTLQDDAQSVGSLRSRQNVMMRPEVAGRIVTMGFTDGGRIRKGDTVVQLDDVLQRAEVRQSDAQVQIARANLKRNQELVAQSFIAQRVVDESAANVAVVEAQLALSCARLERMRVIAPFDGTVGIRNINIGDYVKDGADLVNIEDLGAMYVDFKLPERFQGKLRKDQQVDLQLDAMPGRTFKAKIEAIDPQIDANGRSISVRAVLPNTAGEPMQRPAGAGGPGGAGGAGAKPAVAAKPVAKPAPRPAAPASAAVAAPRPVVTDPVQLSCAPFSLAARTAAASGAGASLAGASAAGGRPQAAGANAARPAAAAGGAARGGAGAGAGAVGAGAPAGAGGGPLRPGMFARVNTVFKINEKSLTVPEEAIVPQGGRQFVIKVVTQTEEEAKALAEKAKVAAAAAAASAPVVAGAPAAPAAGGAGAAPAPQAPVFVNGKRLVSLRTEVKVGIRRPGRVELTDGVSEGDTVVIAGQQRLLRDNTPVRIVELGRPGGGGGGGGGGGAPAGAGQTGAAPSGVPAGAPNAAQSAAPSGAGASSPSATSPATSPAR